MDEAHLEHAVRYVSLNPVRARLVQQARDWQWSSVSAHLARKDDKLVKVAPVLERYGGFDQFLNQTTDDSSVFKPLRQSETTGRPLGSEEWIEKIEKSTGRTLKAQKRGPKKKTKPIN
jgi:putative transposase